MKVLVDTSVWISFFQDSLISHHQAAFETLLDAEQVAITDVIKHELLVGTTSIREFQRLEDYLSAVEEFSISADWRTEFNRFGFELRKKGLLGRYTDASIAFLAQKKDAPVFSLDRYFHKLAGRRIIRLFT